MPKFYCDYCDTYLTHNTPRFTIKPFYSWSIETNLFILKCAQDSLCGAKAQGECKVLLPEVDGGSGEFDICLCLNNTYLSQIQTSGPVLDWCHHCCLHERQAGETPWQCNTTSHGHGSSTWHGRTTWHEAYGSSNGGTNGHAAWWSNGHASRNASSYGNASLWGTRHASWDGRAPGNGRTAWDGWTPWDAGKKINFMFLPPSQLNEQFNDRSGSFLILWFISGLGTSRDGNATGDATSYGFWTPNVIQRGLKAC